MPVSCTSCAGELTADMEVCPTCGRRPLRYSPSGLTIAICILVGCLLVVLSVHTRGPIWPHRPAVTRGAERPRLSAYEEEHIHDFLNSGYVEFCEASHRVLFGRFDTWPTSSRGPLSYSEIRHDLQLVLRYWRSKYGNVPLEFIDARRDKTMATYKPSTGMVFR